MLNAKCHNPKEIQVYICQPNQFICEHQKQLLPDWNLGVKQVILILQRSRISLRESNPEVRQEKNRLRANFIRWGCDLIFALRDRGYVSDLFDPRNGFPLLSSRGSLTIDDNALVNSLLGYQTIAYENCSLLQHPDWGELIYPGTAATNAPQAIIKTVICSELSLTVKDNES